MSIGDDECDVWCALSHVAIGDSECDGRCPQC